VSPFGPAGDPELRVDRVRDLEPAMRETVGLDELDLLAAVDTDDAGKVCLSRDPIDGSLQAAHAS
jgi:hypothetical protein